MKNELIISQLTGVLLFSNTTNPSEHIVAQILTQVSERSQDKTSTTALRGQKLRRLR